MHHSHTLHFEVLIFIFFTLGTLLNVLEHASKAVNSSLNGISTYRSYFKINGFDQLYKSFGALCVLCFLNWNESAMGNILAMVWTWLPSMFGATPPGWLVAVFVVNPATAGGFGLAWDVLLDLALVYMRKKWPQLNRDVKPTLDSFVNKPSTVVSK